MTLTGSICLTDIPKDMITKSEKNGKKYLNIMVCERQEVSQFGQTHNIRLAAKKDDKVVYIGNMKPYEQQAQPAPQTQEEDDDLPF